MSSPENPAVFPCVAYGQLCEAIHQEGMTLRDWFAGQAILAGGGFVNGDRAQPEVTVSRVAQAAYLLADAMLAERLKGDAA